MASTRLTMNSWQTSERQPVNLSPKRISITVPHGIFEKIVQRSNEEGRSISNLAAFLLERGVNG